MQIFIGYDPRQPIAEAVLRHSIATRSSQPLPITRLQLNQLQITRRGLTEFTYSRFLVPWLCNFEGKALFLDADMLCLEDITEIEKYATAPVSVVKNKQRFEWPSLMLFDCAQCKILTPEFVENSDRLFKMDWADVGSLSPEWNHLVGYDEPQDAKIVHFTKGIPVWPETAQCEYAEHWHAERRAMMSTVSHDELMGRSVHVEAR